MQTNIVHIGLDVDDTQYHGCAFDQHTGEVIDFKCRPTLKGLLNQLARLHKYFPGSEPPRVYRRLYFLRG